MSSLNENSFTTPPGRIVQGSLYEPQTVDINGKEMIYETGKNKGKKRVKYYFAVAVPKEGEEHWASTEWGERIWNFVHSSFPKQKVPTQFAWKIDDGDDEEERGDNKIRNCDREGFAGNWILRLSNDYPSPIWNREGTEQITETNFINCGDWVEVNIDMVINADSQMPSVYLNHKVICFNSYGKRIAWAKDVKSCGFSGKVMGSETPLSSSAEDPKPPLHRAKSSTPPPEKKTTAVTPYKKILGTTPPPGAKTAPPPGAKTAAPKPPAKKQRVMTDAAEYTYEEYIASDWTDEMLIEEGLMLA